MAVLTGFAFVALGFLAPSSVSAAPPGSNDPLTVQETADNTALTYGHSRTFIMASATSRAMDEHKAKIEVNGKTFTVKLDEKTSTVKWGGGGRTLDPADLSALQAMAKDLHARFLADAAGEPALSGNTELLIRSTMLLAEAPAGVKIKDYVIEAPVFTEEPASNEAAPGPAAPEEECAAEMGQHSTGEMTIAACQVADDDGVYYWSCTRWNRTLWHDTAGHCFTSETVNGGPGSSGSLGECGTGVVGIGTYTQDCGEHDRCGRVHGGSIDPYDSDCGDEWWDADDDYLWAQINRC